MDKRRRKGLDRNLAERIMIGLRTIALAFCVAMLVDPAAAVGLYPACKWWYGLVCLLGAFIADMPIKILWGGLLNFIRQNK